MNELIYEIEINSDSENKLMATKRGINQEFGINIYTLYIKQITDEDLLYRTESYTQYFAITYKGK